VAGLEWYPCSRLKHSLSLLHGYHSNQPHRNSNAHRNKNTDQCGDSIEWSQAPDDGCINARNMLGIEEVN